MSITLVNTTTRRAFYTIRRKGAAVVMSFGRLGTRGRSTVVQFADKRSAEVFVEEKVEQKMLRCYERVSA